MNDAKQPQGCPTCHHFQTRNGCGYKDGSRITHVCLCRDSYHRTLAAPVPPRETVEVVPCDAADDVRKGNFHININNCPYTETECGQIWCGTESEANAKVAELRGLEADKKQHLKDVADSQKLVDKYLQIHKPWCSYDARQGYEYPCTCGTPPARSLAGEAAQPQKLLQEILDDIGYTGNVQPETLVKIHEVLDARLTPPVASRNWTKQDYDHSAAIGTVVERIVRRVAENAIRLAIVRHDLENDTELTPEEIVKDVLGVVMGEDASCDPDNDESVEILWAEKELRETLKEYPAMAAALSPAQAVPKSLMVFAHDLEHCPIVQNHGLPVYIHERECCSTDCPACNRVPSAQAVAGQPETLEELVSKITPENIHKAAPVAEPSAAQDIIEGLLESYAIAESVFSSNPIALGSLTGSFFGEIKRAKEFVAEKGRVGE